MQSSFIEIKRMKKRNIVIHEMNFQFKKQFREEKTSEAI